MTVYNDTLEWAILEENLKLHNYKPFLRAHLLLDLLQLIWALLATLLF